MFTYVKLVSPGAFSQDVSALSHELGEYVDDPLVVNSNGNHSRKVRPIRTILGHPRGWRSGRSSTRATATSRTRSTASRITCRTWSIWNILARLPPPQWGGEMTFHNNPFHLTFCSNGG